MKKKKITYISYGLLMIALIAANVYADVGVCVNSTHIKYVQNLTVNGQNYYTQTDPKECTRFCVNDANGIGAICENQINASPILMAMWVLAWVFVEWFRRWYTRTYKATGLYRLVPYALYNVVAWFGLLIATNSILIILTWGGVLLTTVIMMWEGKTELERMTGKSGQV